MESLTFLLDRYGFPTMIAIATFYWIAKKLLEPLVERHAAYLDTTAAAYTALAAAYTALAYALTRQTELLEKLTNPPAHP